MSVSLNSSAASHAASLISSGKVTKGGGWSGPSASEENSYIEKNGISNFGKWYLGVRSDTDSKTKEHYAYPFSNNFQTVNREGLIAAEKRAAQNGAESIATKARSLVDKIDGKNKKTKATINFQNSIHGKKLIVNTEEITLEDNLPVNISQ